MRRFFFKVLLTHWKAFLGLIAFGWKSEGPSKPPLVANKKAVLSRLKLEKVQFLSSDIVWEGDILENYKQGHKNFLSKIGRVFTRKLTSSQYKKVCKKIHGVVTVRELEGG